jgi:unsaturated rhamnogalacturonyl hydrolase
MEWVIQEGFLKKPAWNREQKEDKRYNWSYVNALFLKAMLRIYQVNGERKYFDFVDGFMDSYVEEDGMIRSYDLMDYNIDHICGGTVLMDLYQETGKEKYKLAVELLFRQLKEQPRTEEGSFWHKKIYPHQVWLDGLYMAQPFYMRYGAEHGRLDLCRDSYLQFKTVEKRMKDPVTGLYYHGYDCSRSAFWCNKETGLSKSFWLRSIGWLAMAYVDVMEVMPEELEEEKKEMMHRFQNLIDSMLPFEEEINHMWYQVPDQGGREGNYLETSGSGMFAYALLKGNRLHYLEDSYKSWGGKIFDGISKKELYIEDKELQLGGICLVAGLGGDGVRRDGSYEYYISEPVVENDGKGMGPFVLAYTEL